jgi:peptidoglycan/LPS O-acetylase OafA/YrhL
MRLNNLPADTVQTTPARAARPARLLQIDVMRLLICASVVATHVVGNANPITSVAPNAVTNLLHYTRQAFFFISALVLVHAYREGPGQLRRRVSVLGVPYLVWSTIYAVIGLAVAYSWWAAERLPWTWLVGLVQGTDGYHMYFLLVSVEFAVVFPAFLALLRATKGHHGLLLLISGAVELGLMALYHYVYLPDGWWRAVAGESSLTAYQFWVVAGGVAALHFDRFHRWVTGHRLLVWGTLGLVCAAATAVFLADVTHGETAEYASRSLQPVTVPLSLAAIGAFYLLSVRIAAIQQPTARRLIVSGTYLSFGIYLSHPALLTGLLYVQKALPGSVTRHAVGVTVVLCLVDFALAVVAAELLSRTRWSKALVGRPRRAAAPRADASPSSPAAASAPAPVGPAPVVERVPVDRPAPAPART